MRKAIVVVALILGGCGGSAKPSGTSPSTATAPTTSTTAQSSQTTATSSTTSAPPGRALAEVHSAGGALRATITGDGTLAAAAPDGKGGWFVAGNFTQVDGAPAHGLAHILADGTIDKNWHGALESSGQTALVASPDTLYAAGSIDDKDRSHLVALDAASGALRRSLPVPLGPISALALGSGRLFVATSTTTSADRPSCLEAIDPQTGAPVSGFSAGVHRTPELGCISDLRADGRWLYLAGAFGAVNGTARPRLARVDAGTGALDTTWSPAPAAVAGPVYQIAVGPGFVVATGAPAAVSALETTDGAAATAWHPPSGIADAGPVAVLGDAVLVAGRLHGRSAVLVLSAATGALRSSWSLTPGRSALLVSPSGSAALVALGHG